MGGDYKEAWFGLGTGFIYFIMTFAINYNKSSNYHCHGLRCTSLYPSGAIISDLRLQLSVPELDSVKSTPKSKLHYDRRLVNQSALVPGTHLEPATNFSLPLFNYFFLDSYGFVDVWDPF
jgi:hypothetical protein